MGRIAVVEGAFNGGLYFLLLCGVSGSAETSLFLMGKAKAACIRDQAVEFHSHEDRLGYHPK